MIDESGRVQYNGTKFNKGSHKIEAHLRKVIEAIHATPEKVVIEFAGAGSQALAWLHGVGGSSRTILEATDRYAATSLIEAIGFEPNQYASPEVARAMATTAYARARSLATADTAVVGIGCSATIATDRLKRGEHRCCLAARDGQGLTTYNLILKKGARSRQQEEEVVSLLLIKAIAEICGLKDAPSPALLAAEILEKNFQPITLLMQLMAGEVEWVKIDSDGQMTSGQQLPNIALLSGSFNPLHDGHRGMARAGADILKRQIYFELPIINADKAPVGVEETQRRIAQFENWATVILSRAPLFNQKAQLFPGSVFLLGIDTAERLLQPRFYHNNPAEMLASLAMIRAAGCHFLVAGRLMREGRFLTLADLDIPPGYEALFEQIPEEKFRVDISSTKIRKKTRHDLPDLFD